MGKQDREGILDRGTSVSKGTDGVWDAGDTKSI